MRSSNFLISTCYSCLYIYIYINSRSYTNYSLRIHFIKCNVTEKIPMVVVINNLNQF